MSSNFGSQSNGKMCACGSHHGTGDYTPEQRAAMAKRMSHTMPAVMSDNMNKYLSDWELRHGEVRYKMEVVGESSGDFKSKKGEKIVGPVFVDINAPAKDDDLFHEKPQRADIHN